MIQREGSRERENNNLWPRTAPLKLRLNNGVLAKENGKSLLFSVT